MMIETEKKGYQDFAKELFEKLHDMPDINMVLRGVPRTWQIPAGKSAVEIDQRIFIDLKDKKRNREMCVCLDAFYEKYYKDEYTIHKTYQKLQDYVYLTIESDKKIASELGKENICIDECLETGEEMTK